jgi:LPS-assembly lipoprotein
MKHVIAMIGVVFFLTGCGFRPLYGTAGDGSSVASAMTSIAVKEQRTRAGQLVRNEILSSGRTDTPRYRLELTVTESHPYVSRLPGERAERLRATLVASYVLREIASAKLVTQGSTRAAVGYDTVREPVTDMQAKSTAVQRAAIELGQDIKLRLAAALSQ